MKSLKKVLEMLGVWGAVSAICAAVSVASDDSKEVSEMPLWLKLWEWCARTKDLVVFQLKMAAVAIGKIFSQ